MRVPLSWLADFVPHGVDPRDREAVRRLAGSLDGLGLVVDGIDHVGEELDGVVLARVVAIEPIEGADRIRKVLVDAGPDAPSLEIVCGAWNFAIGDVVPLATIGTTLPNGMVIAKRKLRGAVSYGMLCSPAELGLAADAEGILVLASTSGPRAELPTGVVLGASLAEHLGVEADVVLDVAIEPNRPDCLSIAGIARDLAASLGLAFTLPSPEIAEGAVEAASLASVAVASPELCPQLAARVLTGVEVLPSAGRVARRLFLAGMRPVSSVVDASNYVMLELGRPTHPYDLDRLAGGGIVARAAREGEELTTLDGVARVLGRATDPLGRVLEVQDCLICDATDRPVGLAGIMGGAETEITGSTTTVLLEVACFDAVTVARTAKRQGLRSEASVRFERGVDPATTRLAADRFAELLIEAAVAAGVDPPVVARGLLTAEAPPAARLGVELRLDRLNALLGTDLAADQVVGILAPIGFPARALPSVPGVDGATPGAPGGAFGTVLEVEVPSFRPDVEREIDVIEEVARHYGYGRIVATVRRSPRVGRLTPVQVDRRRMRRLLAGLAASEAFTSPLVDPDEDEYGDEAARGPLLRLANPMAREQSALRGSLLPGLLGALRHNVSHRNPDIRLFEIGHVFGAPAPAAGLFPGPAEPLLLPDERDQLGVLLAVGDDDAATAVACWRLLLDGLAIEPSSVSLLQASAGETLARGSSLAAGLHPTRSALLVASGASGVPVEPGRALGAVGEVDPAELVGRGLPDRRVGWLVVDLDLLLALPRRSPGARTVSHFPSSDLDLAFVLGEAVPAGQLEEVLAEAGGAWCESVRLVDVYRGPSVAPGTRGLTYRLRFCAPDRTLGEAELAERRQACVAAAEQRLAVRLRS